MNSIRPLLGTLALALCWEACSSGGLPPAAAAPAAPAAPQASEAAAPSPLPSAPPATSAAASAPERAPEAADLFTSSVKPLLATSCAPCHVPGGKTYERLPWDDAASVRAHADGILRRLKDENRETFAAWLAVQP